MNEPTFNHEILGLPTVDCDAHSLGAIEYEYEYREAEYEYEKMPEPSDGRLDPLRT